MKTLKTLPKTMTKELNVLNETCGKSKNNVLVGWWRSLSVDLIGRNSHTNFWQNKRTLASGESGFESVHWTRGSWSGCSEALRHKPLFAKSGAKCVAVFWGGFALPFIVPARQMELWFQHSPLISAAGHSVIPKHFLKNSKLFWSSGFVKMSATCSWVLQCSKTISPLLTNSLI